MIHDFIELALEAYPEQWMKVIPVSSSIPHILLLRFTEKYDENGVWKATKEMTAFHKLSWKFNEDPKSEMEEKEHIIMSFSCRTD